MFSGALHVRDRLPPGGDRDPGDLGGRDAGGRLPAARDSERKITAISVFERGPAVRREQVRAGPIGKLWGLRGVQIGDTPGGPPAGPPRHRFAPPTLGTVGMPPRPPGKGAAATRLTPL